MTGLFACMAITDAISSQLEIENQYTESQDVEIQRDGKFNYVDFSQLIYRKKRCGMDALKHLITQKGMILHENIFKDKNPDPKGPIEKFKNGLPGYLKNLGEELEIKVLFEDIEDKGSITASVQRLGTEKAAGHIFHFTDQSKNKDVEIYFTLFQEHVSSIVSVETLRGRNALNAMVEDKVDIVAEFKKAPPQKEGLSLEEDKK